MKNILYASPISTAASYEIHMFHADRTMAMTMRNLIQAPGSLKFHSLLTCFKQGKQISAHDQSPGRSNLKLLAKICKKTTCLLPQEPDRFEANFQIRHPFFLSSLIWLKGTINICDNTIMSVPPCLLLL